ncbi:MAG: ThuA domain-containing protein [Planctomycetota bacterium]|jgi:type 1 glutamine amidotransferase
MSQRSKVIKIALLAVLCFALVGEAGPLKALIVDGQNNHNWKGTTPVMKKILANTGLFTVDVATSPARGQSMAGFKPNFAKYDVVLSNYNGADWPKETQATFVEYVRSGGGVVIFHAANNSFQRWNEYNEIIGIRWGGNEKTGPYIRWRDGKVVRDMSPGGAGGHGPQHAFQVVIRNKKHPITKGLPEKWMHVKDELYAKLRGPAKNLTLLATAYAAPNQGGTGEHEPMLFTINYGKGRVFHTVLGHASSQMESVGFIVTLQRGTEWAATGKVTQKVPEDLPSATEVRRWKNFTNPKPVISSGKETEMDDLLEQVKTYDWGQSREPLTKLSDMIRDAYGSPAKLRRIEKSLLGLLRSDAKRAGKQFVCRKLSIIGTEESVPTLGAMLIEPKTSDMARYALERIPGAAVDEALRNALQKATGKMKVGIINTLGQRRDNRAVRALRRLIGDSDPLTAGAAVAALGNIAGPRATRTLAQAKDKTSGKLRVLVCDAYLKCADELAAQGKKEQALAIYNELMKEPKPIKIAAFRGRINLQKKVKK